MYPFSQQADEDVYYQEARLDLTGNTLSIRHAVTLGGSYERNNGTLASDFIYTDEDLFGFPDISYVNPRIPDRSLWQHDESSRVYNLGITGLFAQYIVEPTPRLVATLAGRYDRLALDATRGSAPKVEDTFDAFSPKLSATFKLLDAGHANQLNAYGAYSQAFLPPRKPSALQAAETPLNLQPENIENYEAGLKGSGVGGRLSWDASYFYMTEDGVVLNKRQGPFFVPTNAGLWKFKGFETSAGLSISPKLSAYINASIYRNRFGDFVVQSEEGDTVLTENRLVLSPDFIVNWGADLRPVPTFVVSGDVKHVSGTFGDEGNTFKIDGYTLVDVAASWHHGPLRLTLSVRNLFDEDYYFDVGSESADPGPPRQLLLSATIRVR
jgi:outer membrane receptor protein involved in Fe transport